MWRKVIPMILLLAGILVFSMTPASAQTGIVWSGQFFNNIFLADPAVLVRQDSAIAFDWGSGSPGSGVNSDNFSARWGADPFFNAGTYRFYAMADDSVRVTVDFQTVIIDTFNQPLVGQVVSVDITLTQGQHHVQVDYKENGGNAYVYVTWANLATNPSGPNFPAPNQSLPVVSSGPWTAQYYANTTLTGSPTLIQSETSPSHNWGAASPVASLPVDNFSARWTSTQVLNAGTYQLMVRADDGVRVYVDGVLRINEWHGATGQTYSVSFPLTAGAHNFMIEFYEAGGVAFMEYSFLLAGGTIATPPPVITGAAGTITAYRLNVRDVPNAITGNVLTKISRNEVYAIVGRNFNTTWWQINVNGVIGWVNARYVTAVNTSAVPITSNISNPTTTPTSNVCSSAPAPRLIVGRLGRVTPGVSNNIRALPTIGAVRLGRIPTGQIFSVLAGPQCADGYLWWQVNYNGIIGWTAEGRSNEYWIEPI